MDSHEQVRAEIRELRRLHTEDRTRMREPAAAIPTPNQVNSNAVAGQLTEDPQSVYPDMFDRVIHEVGAKSTQH
jgi:hypothetical protein